VTTSNRSFSNTRAMPRGMTLLETVILMALTAVLSGIVVTGMGALFRYNRSAHRRQVGQTALQQMTTRLRADIHEATGCLWDAENQTLRLELPEAQMLVYQKTKNRWVRALIAGEAKPITTSFGLDDSFQCYCPTKQANQGELVRLILMNRSLAVPKESGKTERTLRSDIVAVVGRSIEYRISNKELRRKK